MAKVVVRALCWFMSVGSQSPPPRPMKETEKAHGECPHMVGLHYRRGTLKLGIYCFYSKWRQDCSLFGGDVTIIPQDCLLQTQLWETSYVWRRLGLAFWAYPARMCREAEGPRWIASPSTESFSRQQWGLVPTYPLQLQFHSFALHWDHPLHISLRAASLSCSELPENYLSSISS